MAADGLHVPGYRVEVLLGVGASSDVWRARVRETGAEVALKRIRAVAPAAFEAEALARIDHPNLIQVHDVISIDDGVVLVLDFAGGGSLARLLVARGRLHPGEVVGALTPIASALAALHAAAIVHADVSPSNILFSAEGLPLLADLGVAHLATESALGVTAAAYADPFALPGESAGYESDVYALGAVAFHALTGTTLGQDRDALEELLAAGIPVSIAEVVRDAVQEDPRRRPSAAGFALDLRHSGDAIRVELRAGRHATTGAGAVLTRGARLPKPELPAPRPKRRSDRRRLGPVLGLVVSIALIGFAVLAWSRPSKPQQASDGVPVRVRTSSSVALPTPTKPRPSPQPVRWQQVLSELDSRRELAYARRDPRLLARVYASSPLRAHDSAQLLRLVPVGCGLRGVRSVYGVPVVVAKDAESVTLRVAVRLLASTLICHGRQRGTASGASGTTMTITLSRAGSDYRIADQRRQS